MRHTVHTVHRPRHQGAMYRFAPSLYAVNGRNAALPAVFLWDLFDGNSDLVAEVSPSIHHSISAPPQHHPVTGFIGVILILYRNTYTHILKQ